MSFPNLNAYATNSWANLNRYDAFVKGKAGNAIITLNGAAQGDNSGLKAEKGDAFRGASWLGRNLWGGAATSDNNNVRNDFLQSVLDAFGVKDAQELPESVRTALEMKNFDGKGHPLTARRISAVTESVTAEQAKAKRKAFDALVKFAEVDKDLSNQLLEELNTCSVARLKQLAGIGGLKERIGKAVDGLKLPTAKAELCERYALRLLAHDSGDKWQDFDSFFFDQLGGLDERAIEFMMKQKIDLRQIAFGEKSISGVGVARMLAAPGLGRLIVQTLGEGGDADLRTAYENLCGMCKQPPGNPSDVKSAYMELLGRMVDGVESFNGGDIVKGQGSQLDADVLATVNKCGTLFKRLYNTPVELADNFMQQAQGLTKIVNRCVERLEKEQGFDKEKARTEVLDQLNRMTLNTVEDQQKCLGLLAKVGENGNDDIQTFVNRITDAAKHHLVMDQAIEAKETELNDLLGRTGVNKIKASMLGNIRRVGYPLSDLDKSLDFSDIKSDYNKSVRKTLGAFDSVITSYNKICQKIDSLTGVDDDFKSRLKTRAANYGSFMEQVAAILTNDKFWGLVSEVMDKNSDLANAVREYSLQDERGSLARIASAALKIRLRCHEVCEEIGQEISQNVKAKNGEGVIDYTIYEQFTVFAFEQAGAKFKSAGGVTGNINFNKKMAAEILQDQMQKNVNLLHPSDRSKGLDLLAPVIANDIVGWFFNRT